MTADALTVIDVYATALTWAVRGWYTALTILTVAAAWLIVAIGRAVFDRIGASFARAQQTITDIQQPRKEEL
ncbi:hypothetical protein [Streptomyces flavofungini]|uniref:hypothetical protein n=1 Tax=Streptomyces flavofungini TaxID=68200 RepID=UPI0034DEA1E7